MMAGCNTRRSGAAAETRAVEHLVASGYRVVARNYATGAGEIDCIAESPEGETVFVEVKSEGRPGRGHPFFRVSRAKQRQLMRMARTYRAEHESDQRPCRFDVIAVTGERIEHLRNAFIG